MRRILGLLLGLLLCLQCALAEDVAAYRGDGRYMLTVTAETTVARGLFGADPFATLPVGARVIATNVSTVSSGTGELWYEVYLPGSGYGYIRGDAVVMDEPLRVAYQPGFGVSAALFNVENPENYRVEIVSLDDLEHPVMSVQGVITQKQQDGSYRMGGAFNSASDVCKTTTETLCATLYDVDDQPVEVLTIIFDAPNW